MAQNIYRIKVPLIIWFVIVKRLTECVHLFMFVKCFVLVRLVVDLTFLQGKHWEVRDYTLNACPSPRHHKYLYSDAFCCFWICTPFPLKWIKAYVIKVPITNFRGTIRTCDKSSWQTRYMAVLQGSRIKGYVCNLVLWMSGGPGSQIRETVHLDKNITLDQSKKKKRDFHVATFVCKNI